MKWIRGRGGGIGLLAYPTLAVIGTLVAYSTTYSQAPQGQPQRSIDVMGVEQPPPDAVLAKGEQMFRKMCAGCHGGDAEGDGPEHTEFIPHPSNLTLMRDTPSMTFSIVQNGIQGTAMPAHPQVKREDFEAVLAWVMSRPPDTTREWSYPWELRDQPIPPDLAPTIYQTACAPCHGQDGRGDGPWAKDNPHIWPKPANFHARNSELGRLYYFITYGREGTMMAPQKDKFPPNARWALAQYIYDMYDPSSDATIPTGPMEEYKNPYTPDNTEVVQLGTRIYDLYCAYCHGQAGKGTFLAPRLIDREWKYGGGNDNALYVVINQGIPGKLMPGHKDFPERDKWAVITYLRSRGGLPYPLPSHEPEHEHEEGH